MASEKIIDLLFSHIPLTVGIVFLFGFLDYWLTVVGFRWHQRYRQAHFEYERYEQNPLWNRSIHQTRRYDWRHAVVLGSVAITLGYFMVSDQGQKSFETVFFMSLLLVTYVNIVAGHLLSMRRSRCLGAYPQEVQGKVRYSYWATLRLGMISDQMEALPMLVLAVLLPHPVTFAAAASPLLMAATRALWLRLHELRTKTWKSSLLRRLCITWECAMAACHMIIVVGGAFWLWERLS